MTCFQQAAECLPMRLRTQVNHLPEEVKQQAEEFRLRVGRPLSILTPEGEQRPWTEQVSGEDLETVVNMATEFSRYSAVESLRNGYLSARGGCRIGLCGTAVLRDGVNTNLRDLTSVAIRIAREKIGIAEPLMSQLFEEGVFQSTLILAPPGGGKTTLLRDMVRCLSNGGEGRPSHRVSVVDERGEIAVCCQGEPQMDMGSCTDVLDGCPKAMGIPMVMRAMNPQIIAVDEITMEEDIRAMASAANCGVSLLATIHAAGTEELMQKPLYHQLLNARVFDRAVLIRCEGAERVYRVEELPC